MIAGLLDHNAMSQGILSYKRETSGCSPEIYLGCYPAVGIVLFLIGIAVFGVLAFSVVTHGPQLQWDVPIDQFLHQDALHSPWWLVKLMIGTSFMGREMIIIAGVLLGLYFYSRSRWRELTMLVIGVGGGEGLFEVLSRIFNRPRPVWQHPISDVLHVPGFPSGHTISAVLLYGLIAYLLVNHLNKNWQKTLVIIAALLLIIFIGFSRLFVGDHYLTDVIAGYAVGLAWGALVYTLVERFFPQRIKKAR